MAGLLLYLRRTPRHESSGDGDLDIAEKPKRNSKQLPSDEKLKAVSVQVCP